MGVNREITYDFDEYIERRGTGCVKWDLLGPAFGNPDLIPLWIADTDFRIPVEVEEALRRRLDCPVLGYATQPRNFGSSLAGWLESRHGWKPETEWICSAQGLVRALAEAINALTEPGDGIILTTPIYDPFYSIVERNNREIIRCPLRLDEYGSWNLDFNLLEDCLKSGARAMLLCNPHNPTGKVWSAAEMEGITELCVRYKVLLLSDDIHCDILRKGKSYTPAGSVSDDIKEFLVQCHSPGKTFNIAGLKAAAAIIPDKSNRDKFTAYQERFHGGKMNALAFTAFSAAYSECGGYVDQLNRYLDNNAAYLMKEISENLPDLKPYSPEGTFLMLCDCSPLGLESWELVNSLSEKAGILFSRGAAYGDETKTFVRINFGCRKALLEQAVEKLRTGITAC